MRIADGVTDLVSRHPTRSVLTLGVATAGLVLAALPGDQVPMLIKGLQAAVARFPLSEASEVCGRFLDGVRDGVAATALRLGEDLREAGVDLTHQAREAFREFRAWLDARGTGLRSGVGAVIQGAIDNPRAAAGEALAFLGALSGAWEGAKLIGRGLKRILPGLEPAQPAPEGPARDAQRLEISLSLTGEQAERFLQRHGLAPAPLKAEAERSDLDLRGIDLSRLFPAGADTMIRRAEARSQGFSAAFDDFLIGEGRAELAGRAFRPILVPLETQARLAAGTVSTRLHEDAFERAARDGRLRQAHARILGREDIVGAEPAVDPGPVFRHRAPVMADEAAPSLLQ